MENSRQLAFIALRSVHRGAYADAALDRVLRQTDLNSADRRLVTELVYGSVRRMRSLDAAIDQLATKKADRQPPDLRAILHLGLYQLRYLTQIPAAAAVNSTVDLAKKNGFSGLTGFVNGLLRQYIRLQNDELKHDSIEHSALSIHHAKDPLQLPENPVERLGILHSYPNWIVEVWLKQFGLAQTEQLCQWFNQPPAIDLRVNPLRTSIDTVEAAMREQGVSVSRLPNLPQAPHRVCIEGGRPIKDILKAVWQYLPLQGRVVTTAGNLESLYAISQGLAELHARNIDVVQSSVNRLEQKGNQQIFAAVDPIFILSGEKLD